MLIVWFFVYKKLAQFAVRGALPPRRSESPGCAADNKPSCVLHLLGWFIGSRGFSSLEQRPEFWVLHKLGKSWGRRARRRPGFVGDWLRSVSCAGVFSPRLELSACCPFQWYKTSFLNLQLGSNRKECQSAFPCHARLFYSWSPPALLCTLPISVCDPQPHAPSPSPPAWPPLPLPRPLLLLEGRLAPQHAALCSVSSGQLSLRLRLTTDATWARLWHLASSHRC